MIAGAQIPVVRASLMISCALFAKFLGRRPFSLDVLWLSMFFILLFDPQALFSVSFQLSCLAVLGILIFSKGKSSEFKVSLSATLFTFPLISYYFGQISWISVLANMLFVPIFGYIIQPLLLVLTICLFAGVQFQLLLKVIDWSLSCFNFLIEKTNQIPFIASEWSMSLPQVLVTYGLLLLFSLIYQRYISADFSLK
jgi:competence protein ComEC